MEKTKNKKIIQEPLWLSVSESAKFGGVQTKTIRRALKQDLKFKIRSNRYFIDCASLLTFLNRNIKLRNKLATLGLGRYVKEWRKEQDDEAAPRDKQKN